MVLSKRNTTRALTEAEAQTVLADALEHADLAGKRVLVIIPDSTRTAPIAFFFQLLDTMLSPYVPALDYLVALGTHPPMDDDALSALLGVTVFNGRAGASRIFNHRWDLPETFVTVGTIPAAEVEQASGGRFALDVPVRINRLLVDPADGEPYDQIIVLGPVFPHEVAGFSGGNKYFIPGVSGEEIIDVTHWLGALLTSRDLIGSADTPVRRMIDRAASLISTPRFLIALVMHKTSLHGLFAGDMINAWLEATLLSAELDIVTVDRPFRRALSMVPELYDDLWTAAKGMYKLEPAMQDGSEVIIYAPHIDEVSYVHGKHIDEVGYHVRDYFVAQWDRFKHIPWGVLAHSTHLCGDGTYIDGVERARVQVTLASGIPRERCERIGLGYIDPATIDPEQWAGREDEGILLVRRAGEILYRLKHG